MKKSLCSMLLLLCLLTSLLAGCSTGVPLQTPGTPATETLLSAPSEPMPTSALPEATESAAPETEPPETLPEEPEPAPETPGTEAGDYFYRVEDASCDHFSNGLVEILYYADGRVVRRSGAAEQETLLTLTVDPETTQSLIGVTNGRLYFGWNEVEDWWGVNVYSLDYQGGSRREYGSDWDPEFGGGWLVLYGFRSDVSPTELLLIDRNDSIVASYDNGEVWDGEIVDEDFYYIYIENRPAAFTEEAPAGGYSFDLIRVEPDGTQTVVKVFTGLDHYYTPAFIEEGVICFFEKNEYYDLLTFEPTKNPYGD